MGQARMRMASEDNKRTGSRQVALFGTFDTENFGDCLFPLIVKHELRKRLEDVEVVLFSPTSRVVKTANYSEVHAFHQLGDVFRTIVPAFVIGGGALLATEHVLFAYPQIRLLYPYSLKCWLLPAMIACSWKCPLVLNGIGLGPFDDAYGRLAAKYLKGAAIRGVRDPVTQTFLTELGIRSEIVPDCGLLVPELQSDSEWEVQYRTVKTEFGLPEKYVAVQASLYLGSQLEAVAETVSEAVRRAGLPVVLIPICHHLNDLVALRLMQGVFSRKGIQTVLVDRILTTLETAAVLSRAEIYAGTSLHGALVTLSFGKPVVSFSLSTMKKNRAVLSVLGLEDRTVDDVSALPDRIHEALHGPRDSYRTGLRRATRALAVFFDRVSEVIWSQSGAPLATPLKMKVSSSGEVICAGIEDDLVAVKELCQDNARRLSLTRRCAAFVVRNNRAASEYYDRVLHWWTAERTG